MFKRKKFKKIDGLKYGWLKDAKRFLLIVVAVFVVLHFVIGFSFVKGRSMEPTLSQDEIVMYTRINSDYRTGDVVSVRIPSGEFYVKRVIASEGDTIDIKDGEVYLNGKLLEEAYVKNDGTYEQEGTVRYPLTLKDGQVFVMGDNRDVSMDSRSFGVVGKRQIKGKIIFQMGRFYIKKTI